MLATADAAFRLAPWHDFAVMLGGAAAALTGLVFVAVSLQLATLARDSKLRHRASTSVLFLFTIVAASAAILAPQSPRALGAEFLALVLTASIFGYRGVLAAGEQRDNFGRLLLLVSTPTSLFGILADISLIVERGYGLYIATPCLVITLGITLASAWAVLSAAAEEVSDRLRA